jgi:hypothetical protein
MKEFINLPTNYKKILKEIDKLNLDEVIKTENYENIIKTYNKINDILERNDVNAYDINRMINYYKKKDNTIKLLKKLMKLKNKMILMKAKKSKNWENIIKKISKKCNKLFIGNCNIDTIEKGLINLLNKYKDNWLGYWTIIDIDKKGKIRDINLFDSNDYDVIYTYIGKRYKLIEKVN